MAIVRKFGKPHLFLTFTANGKWEETIESIYEGQDPNRRPDMVCRVFNAKLAELKKDILERKVLGRVVAHSYHRVSKTRSPTCAHGFVAA